MNNRPDHILSGNFMKKIFIKFYKKLIFKQWVIGICSDNIENIIKTKKFDPKIKWLFPPSLHQFYADPFILPSKNDEIKILFEELKFKEDYGKISLMTLNKNFKKISSKLLLDTKSHLSYPFIYKENNKYYIFPEAAKTGKLACYGYDGEKEQFNFLKDIINLPLLDSTILKHNNKYWLFGTLGENTSTYKLNIFFSDNLLGPYQPHTCNPVRSGLNGIRSAGTFIEVDGKIYRPTQNCENNYGESISINKIVKLSETDFLEEFYMDININQKRKSNQGIYLIHTINFTKNLVVVDGKYGTFSPLHQYKKYVRNKRKSEKIDENS